MNSTEESRADALARALFDDVVAPLATANLDARRSAWFERRGDPAPESYFETPGLAVMTPADLAFPGGGSPEGLIDALASYWTARGEDDLAVMAPRLKLIAEALREEAAQSDGEVDILCYTMF